MDNPFPDSIQRIRSTMRHHRANPRKRWSQHYLIDTDKLAAYLRGIAIRPRCVLEIGCGFGALSSILLRLYASGQARLVFIDCDPVAVHVCRQAVESLFRVGKLNDARVSVLHEDVIRPSEALCRIWRDFLPEQSLLTGNVPYHISSYILLFALKKAIAHNVVFLLQRDLAERIAYHPETTSLGRHISLLAKTHIAAYISRNSFYPRPHVDSALLHIRLPENPIGQFVDVAGSNGHRYKGYLDGIENANDLSRFIESGLRMMYWAKRKTIKKNLTDNPHCPVPRSVVVSVLAELGIPPEHRIEQLSNRDVAGILLSMRRFYRRPNIR